MQLVKRAMDRFEGVIDGASVDWRKYMKPSDQARVIPIEALAEKLKERILLGAQKEEGLTLPWDKTNGKVLIRDAKLALWAGWSRHGKTRMVKQVMLWSIRNGYKCLICSMEEEVEEIIEDLATMFCGTTEPTPHQIDQFIAYAKQSLWIYDQQGKVDSQRVEAVVRYATHEFGVTQVMVDSLMMLGVSRDDYEAQSNFVGDLKLLAKETRATIHLVAHMRKRDGKGGDDEPGGLHDIAGGHEIGSKADYVFIPWRDMKRKDITAPEVILKVDKARGRINWLGNIGLKWHDDSKQFTESYGPVTYHSEPSPI